MGVGLRIGGEERRHVRTFAPCASPSTACTVCFIFRTCREEEEESAKANGEQGG